MSQNPIAIPTTPPLTGLSLATDVNNALASVASMFSGNTAPTAAGLGISSLAGIKWHDTSSNSIWLRNQADSAWILQGTIDETNGVFYPANAITVGGTLTTTNIASLSTSQITALTTTAISALTATQLAALSTTAIKGLTSTQFSALTSTQLAGLQPAVIPASAVAGGTSVNDPVRQTVLSGVANSNGQANFITTGTGLRPGLSATAATLLLAFAAGFGPGGAIDYIEQIVADSATFFPTLTANVLSYLTATRVSAGNVVGGATLAPKQEGPTYNQAMQSSLTLNNISTDDFGNTWTNSGVTFTNASPMLAGTYMGVFNGSSSKLSSSAFSSISSFGNGSWSMRGWFKTNAASTNQVLFAAINSSGYGVIVGLSNGGNFQLWLGSTGSSSDIANGTSGPAYAANTAYFVELTYDAVAGKYILYVNGVAGQTIASTAKICGITQFLVGNGGSAVNYWLSGWAQGFEFLPYCQHPNGATYSVPTALASINAAGYASPWWDATNKLWKTPSVASTVAGVNPTFATSQAQYVGEATAGASTISSVVSYAFQGEYVSPWTVGLPGAGTLIAANDNLGTQLKDAQIELLNLVGEGGFSPGDIVSNILTSTGSYSQAFQYRRLRNSTATVTGTSAAFYTLNASSGSALTLTSAYWAYRITASRKKGY